MAPKLKERINKMTREIYEIGEIFAVCIIDKGMLFNIYIYKL